MIAKATPQAIRSIMRRQHITPNDRLNILTFCTHERYEQRLCKTKHNFYSLRYGKEWDTDYGEIPENYNIIEAPPSYVDMDLILCHTTCDRLNISRRLREDLNIPILLHTHVLPDIRADVSLQVNQFKQITQDIDKKTFISNFNRSAWGCSEYDAEYVEHGMDFEFWNDIDELPRDNVCLSVVNDWPNRDWCCGFELWKNVAGVNTQNQLPVRVVGKSPGFSEPAKSIEHLREIYHSSRIFLNTSIHSPVPTVLMEAMACGCAVVSTETCMIPEIIQNGVNGFMSNDPQELRKYATMLMQDEELAKKLGQNAQKTIKEKYNLQIHMSNWNELFYSTIKNYKEY